MAKVASIDGLVVRRMVESDLDSVMHVERDANSHGWRRRTFMESLKHGFECWVVDDPLTGSYTIAHSVMGNHVDSAELYNISVAPRYQGQHVGSTLLDHMLTVARSQQVSSVFLEVRVSNQNAIRLYESRGFSKVGLRQGYYEHEANGREDAHVYRMPIYTKTTFAS